MCSHYKYLAAQLHLIDFCFAAMTSLSDSKAHFAARAKECGVPDALLASLIASGVTTLEHLAFSLNRPGADFDKTKFDDWLKTINGGVAPTIHRCNCSCQQIAFRSQSRSHCCLKAAIENPSRCLMLRKMLACCN